MIIPLAQFEAIYAFVITTLIPSMALAYALSYLGGLLFNQSPREASDEPRGQSFAWNPHTTRQEGIPKAVCWGRNKHFGNEVMRWTDVDPVSGNEVLYKALDYGGGPVQGIAGGIVSDVNHCIDGTPAFNILTDSYIDTWWQTAANVNDDDKTTFVGFTGAEKYGHNIKGKFNSIVTFDSTTLDRLEYRRHWLIHGSEIHTGYEKVYLWYEDAYHLIRTRNLTTEGSSTDTVVVESGGPWEGVTKIKIEVELSAVEFYFRTWRDSAIVTYKLYELRAWRLEDVPVYLNGQPAHNFREVIVRGRPGTLNQTCMEGFEKNKLEYPQETTIVYGEPVSWTTPNKFFDDVEFTLAWLGGLFYYSNDGKVRTHSVDVKVEISEHGKEVWSTILDTTVSGSQLKALYKAYSVNTLVPGSVVHGTQYDFKFSKTTEDQSPTRYGDEVQLRTARGVVNVAFTHPGRALLGIIAQATERLQGDIDVTWVTDDKLVNVFNGDIWEIKWTRNRAFIYLDGITQPVISGDGNGGGPYTVERYDGLDPSRVNLTFIWAWAQWCDAQVPSGVGEETEDRMTCDIICDQQTNVWSITYAIAQIGRMYPYWQGVMLTGWIDKVTDEDIDLITMDNTMARSWKSSYAGYGEMAGSVEVFYKDSAQDYERKPRPVFNTNSGRHTRVIALEGVGVTTESLATRVGNHTLKRNELVKNINATRMTREALRYKLGRVVRIQTNVPGWGQAFRVISAPTASTVKLDRTVEDVVEDDLLWLKTYDTVNKEISLDSYTVDSTAGQIVTIKETWEAGCTPLKNHLAAIGIAGSIKLRRIIKIMAESNNFFNLELETYNTILFDSDAEDPVLTNPDYLHQPVTQLAIPITRTAVMDLIDAMAAPSLKLTKPQLFNCAWVGDDVNTVAWSKRNPDEPILIMWEGETYEIEPDSTTLEFIYWDSETPTVFLTTATATTALAFGMRLACTNTDGVEHPVDMTQSQHGAIIQIGTLIAEQIIISGINALALMNAPAEAGADVTGGHTAANISGQGNLATTNENQLSLANFNEKSVDSLVDGTYAKMLANWKHTSDPTKMDLGLGFAASITTAQIGALAVHTAQINNLAVETLKIKDEAVTVPASVSGLSLVFTSTGKSLYINISGIVYILQTADDGWCSFFFRMKVKRDSTIIYDTGLMHQHTYLMNSKKHIPWATGITDNPSAGSYTYSIEFFQDSPNGDCTLNSPNLFIIETKK